VYRAYFFADLDADTTTVTEAALDRLRQAGATIVEVDMPQLKTLIATRASGARAGSPTAS
jgi:Asp-tRNA(Asn)/Glu-tRNA(Gln) amidotransferase A subunit family amidase